MIDCLQIIYKYANDICEGEGHLHDLPSLTIVSFQEKGIKNRGRGERERESE